MPPATTAALATRLSIKCARTAIGRWHTGAMPRQGNRRPGRPPAANADETRQRIIHAARGVFSEYGYGGATFRAIADRADLTRPSINHYFPSKLALYRQVLHDANESVLGEWINQAEREATLMTRLTALISAGVKANFDDSAGPALLIVGILESKLHPELNAVENHTARTLREFLMRIVNDAIGLGEVAAGIDAASLVESLLLVLYGVGLYVVTSSTIIRE